jgi:hypothetical protein
MSCVRGGASYGEGRGRPCLASPPLPLSNQTAAYYDLLRLQNDHISNRVFNINEAVLSTSCYGVLLFMMRIARWSTVVQASHLTYRTRTAP